MIRYELNAAVGDDALNALFLAAWPNFQHASFAPLLAESLLWVVAHREEEIVGFLRVLACGKTRGLVLGPTVHPSAQRQGIGTALLNEAAEGAKARGLDQLLVEFHPNLRQFYGQADFRHITAGVRRL